jgi:hypothetical protein
MVVGTRVSVEESLHLAQPADGILRAGDIEMPLAEVLE